MTVPFSIELPHHDTPHLTSVDLTHEQIALAVARMYSLFASSLLGVAEAHAVELTIMGQACVLTGDVVDGWCLAETIGHHIGHRPKLFYLLPTFAVDLQKHFGNVPYVACQEEDFDDMYAGDEPSRQVHLYVLSLLVSCIKPRS